MRNGSTHLSGDRITDRLVDGVANFVHGGRGNNFINSVADLPTFLLSNSVADRILFDGIANFHGRILKPETTTLVNFLI